MKLARLAVLGAAFVAVGADPARAGQASLGLRAGSTGLGVELGVSITPIFGVRGGGYFFNYGRTQEESDISYDVDLHLRSFAGFLDLHPLGGSFRLTGGVFYNQNRAEGVGIPTGGTYTINGVAYPSAAVGNLTAEARAERDWAPYLGLGFGTSHGTGRVFFIFDAGVVFQGRPFVVLDATGVLAGFPPFQANLQAEENDVNEDLDDSLYQYYPLVSFGVGFRF
jgi:hypothetical protein